MQILLTLTDRNSRLPAGAWRQTKTGKPAAVIAADERRPPKSYNPALNKRSPPDAFATHNTQVLASPDLYIVFYSPLYEPLLRFQTSVCCSEPMVSTVSRVYADVNSKQNASYYNYGMFVWGQSRYATHDRGPNCPGWSDTMP